MLSPPVLRSPTKSFLARLRLRVFQCRLFFTFILLQKLNPTQMFGFATSTVDKHILLLISHKMYQLLAKSKSLFPCWNLNFLAQHMPIFYPNTFLIPQHCKTFNCFYIGGLPFKHNAENTFSFDLFNLFYRFFGQKFKVSTNKGTGVRGWGESGLWG